MPNKEESKSIFTTDNAILAVLALLIFAASFYFFSAQLREHDVRGLRVFSKTDPYEEMKAAIGDGKVIIKQYLYPGEDERNSYVGLVSAELAGTFSAFNRSVAAFGYVPEEQNESIKLINCINTTDFCSNENIAVQLSDCNCLRIQDGKISVLYDKDKLKDPALRVQLRGVIGGVLKGIEDEKKIK